MGLQAAIAIALQLKAALLGEVGRARAERVLLRSLDGTALLESARVREEFNAQTRNLMVELGRALGVAGTELGVAPVTVAGLLAAGGPRAAPLAETIAEVKSLAAALAELDALNKRLAERSLICLRAYQARVVPRGSGYDRRGAQPALEATSRSQEA